MNNKIHLIGNAHLDPIWLWRWQEGCAEVLQTFRSALDRLKEYNDFVLEKNLQIFRQCLNRRKETKLCTVLHTQYTVIAYPTTIPIGKYYYIVPIDDSS